MKGALLTRPIQSSPLIVEKLLSLNYSIVEQPLIKFIDDKEALHSAYAQYYKYNLVITSKYAAQLVADNWDTPANCYVVGKNSAEILQLKGFNVKYVALNVEELQAKLKAIYDRKLLYLRGNYITQSLPKKIKDLIIYRTDYANSISSETINAITSNKIKIILIFSYKSAESFGELIRVYKLEQPLKEVKLICFSQKIAIPLLSFFSTIYFPKEPSIDQLLKVIELTSSSSKKEKLLS